MKLFGWDTNNFSVVSGDFGSPYNTSRDWRILLLTGLILLIVLAGFAVWTFTEIKNGNFVSASDNVSNTQSVTLNREDLNQAVADFQKKRATYDLLRDRQPEIPNPAR